MTGTEPVLEARALRVSYPGAPVLRGLNLAVRRREIVGLMGDAASGKSTAALALMGLARAPGTIDAGEVLFDGRNLLALPEAELRAIRGRDLAIVVQNPRAALNPMTRVGRQIAAVWRAHREGTGGEAAARAVEMLRRVGINDPERRASAFAHELSGGMAQRALIAMALAAEPRLLIADEPTSGLDVTIQAQVLDDLARSVAEAGTAALIVTQDLGVVANYCDRVAVLHDGVIVEDRPVADFFRAPEHPYSREVLRLQRAATGARLAPADTVTEETLVEVRGLSKAFPIRGSDKVVQAVDGADLIVRRGETLGLVGESGSGKTTVGRTLLRLEAPTAGEVRFRGEDVTAARGGALRALRRRMQIVFQDPYDSVNPRWTVERIVAEPLALHTRLSAAARRARAAELLEMVGLSPDLLGRRPRGLGSGALQRIAIARALAAEPEFLVLDEPTSVLAPTAVNGLIELLRRLQAELGLAYLFISHDLTTVKFLCHRVAVMYLGEIVELGSVRQVFERPAHPYAQSLLAAHLEPDPAQRGRPRTPLEGEIPSPVDLPTGCRLASRCPHAEPACAAARQALTPMPDGRLVRCRRVAEGEISAEEVAA